MSRLKKHFLIITAVVAFFGAIVLAIVLPGRVTASIADNGFLELKCFHIGSKPAAEKTLDLSDCEVIFYEDYFEEGSKIDGLSLVRVKSGRYENDTLDEYFLLRYNKNKSVIILKSDYSNTVFNLKTYEQTLTFYNDLLAAQAGK